jgi:hypothetical protein
VGTLHPLTLGQCCWFFGVMPCCQGLTLYIKVCYLIEIIELQGFVSLFTYTPKVITRLTLNRHYNKRCPCTPNDFTRFWVNSRISMDRT